MTDEDVVARVGVMFGRRVSSWQPRNSLWQRTFIVRVTGAKAVAWMIALRPLLGQRRQSQIDDAVASYAPRSNTLLDDDAAGEALASLRAGASVRAVAARFGTTIWCMYDLRAGRTHRHQPRA